MQVKGNQKRLLEAVTHITDIHTPQARVVTKDAKKRGRKEKRNVELFNVEEVSTKLPDVWKDHIKTIIKIDRTRKKFDTREKCYTTSKETAYYISTNGKLRIEEFARGIRSHWHIENRNHYVKDVTFGEDKSRIRKKPEIMATLRSFALNLMRTNGEGNISEARFRNGINIKRLLSYERIM